jgi:hypothetical protein
MVVDPLRQWGQDRPTVRHYPAFSQITGRRRRNHQILDQKRFMTFENRSRRDLDPDHLFLDLDPRRDLASAARNVSTTLIQPGLAFKLEFSALAAVD